MDYRFAPGTNNFGFDRSVWDEIIRPILPSLDNENGETETQHLDTVETQNDSEYNPYSGLPFEVGRRRQFHQMIQLLHEYHAGDLDPTGEENEDLNDWPLHRVNGRQYSYFDMLFGSVLPRGVEPLPRLDPFTYLNLVEHIKPYRYFNGDINPELYAFEQDKIFVYPGEYCALQFLNDPSSFLVEEYFANEGFCIVFSLYNNSEKKIGTICRLVGHQFYSNEININISVKGYAICEILNLKPLALALEDNVSTTKIYKATHKPENIDKTPFYNFKWSDSLTRRLYHLGDIKTRHYPYPFAQDLKLSLNEFINYMDSFYSTTLELNPTIMSDDPYKYFLESMRITPLNFDQQMEIMQNDNLLCRFRILSEYLAPGMSVYCINCTNKIASLNNISNNIVEFNSNHINPNGNTFKLTAFRCVENIEFSGVNMQASSFFKGYQWKVIHCAQCHSHLGWRFTKIKPEDNLEPFYSINRNCIRMSTKTETFNKLYFGPRSISNRNTSDQQPLNVQNPQNDQDDLMDTVMGDEGVDSDHQNSDEETESTEQERTFYDETFDPNDSDNEYY